MDGPKFVTPNGAVLVPVFGAGLPMHCASGAVLVPVFSAGPRAKYHPKDLEAAVFFEVTMDPKKGIAMALQT